MGTSAKRCAVCGKAAAGGGCEGTVCNSSQQLSQHAAVEALLADLERRTGVSIVAEADAELLAHAEAVTRARAEATPAMVERIAAWFSARARGLYEARSRPSCPNCGGWLYVDVDIDEVELHASGTREIVCINCAWRCYVWVGTGSGRDGKGRQQARS